jgi:hypothetical protein
LLSVFLGGIKGSNRAEIDGDGAGVLMKECDFVLPLLPRRVEVGRLWIEPPRAFGELSSETVQLRLREALGR